MSSRTVLSFGETSLRRSIPRWLRNRPVGIGLALVTLAILYTLYSLHQLSDSTTSDVFSPPFVESTTPEPVIIPDPVPDPRIKYANELIDALFARQSTSLSQARSRYTLKTGRSPPQHYDKWYDFAKRRHCLIDDYDQIHRDFAIFHQLEEEKPGWFKERFQKVKDTVQGHANGLFPITIRDGKYTDGHWDFEPNEWNHVQVLLRLGLPDMSVVYNLQDEPRVVFNARTPDAHAKALKYQDETYLNNYISSTDEYFGAEGQKHCLLPNSKVGFGDLVNKHVGFLRSSGTTRFTTDLYPVISVTKINPCFSDILVPAAYYYRSTSAYPTYDFSNNITWENKTSRLYWRGSSTGGQVNSGNYHDFPRFRLADISRSHSSIIDAKLTHLIQFEGDDGPLREQYGIKEEGAAREEVYQYKYVLDIDGNSYSGRFFGLMTSGSLVFKSTVFTEFYVDWLRPYEHFIPVLPDLSDLVTKVQWALDNEEEARRIQEAGKAVVERVITDEQNDCYWHLAMLEFSHLQGHV